MTQTEIWTDGAVGETRQVTLADGRPTRIRIHRWSDAGRRLRRGEIHAARIGRLDRRLGGAFVAVGSGAVSGFLPLDKRARAEVGEGLLVRVEVVREAARGKAAVLALLGPAEGGPRLLSPAPDDAPREAPSDPAKRVEIDALIERALARKAPIPGGGALTIEPTAALLAIDVDGAGRDGPKDPDQFALDLNIAAAETALREVGLRGLGGIIAIDFASMRTKAAEAALIAAVKAAAHHDDWSPVIGGISRFGVLELARSQWWTPLHEVLLAPDGRPTPETQALEVLREIERASWTARGRPIRARASPEALDWLAAGHIEWREALNRRVGALWQLEPAAAAARADVEVD